jgi:hypothetical protein
VFIVRREGVHRHGYRLDDLDDFTTSLISCGGRSGLCSVFESLAQAKKCRIRRHNKDQRFGRRASGPE